MQVKENLKKINERINNACLKVNRKFDEIILVAVTKGVGEDKIKEAIECGVVNIGENYFQEAKTKLQIFGDKVRWHFLGHLQTNKAKFVVPNFFLIHSLDSIKLGEEINKQALKINKVQEVLIEVNISQDGSKFGVNEQELFDLLKNLSILPAIRIKGLMTVAPLVENPEDTRPYFRKLKNLQGEINKEKIDNINIEYLSMGMTQDFEIAIEEGANIIRIGRGLFGERK